MENNRLAARKESSIGGRISGVLWKLLVSREPISLVGYKCDSGRPADMESPVGPVKTNG